MDLTKLDKSPLEISVAQPDAHGHILLRDIYARPPLKLSTYSHYRNDEILLAAARGDYPEDFRQALTQMLSPTRSMSDTSAAPTDTATPWRLWQVLINPQLVTLNFYRYQDDYSEAKDGLRLFQNDISLEIAGAAALGLVVHRPDPDLMVDFEISSSGKGGTHNLRLTVHENGEMISTVAISLLPRK